ncbi:MAG TPA: MFS transporter [Thermomicrobiales bacterium]|nr:MFS transporter [Thermomicrobiales bacterium]
MTNTSRPSSVWRDPLSLIMMFAVFLGAIDLTVVATIMPRMISDLGINTADIDRYIWIVNSYLIGYVVSIPLFGRLADIIGIRNSLVISTVIFAAGSWWCARGETLQDLIFGRAIQGFGAGALLPLALAAAAALFEGSQRAHAIGVIGATDEIGWVSGPAYGAIVVNTVQIIDDPWRLVFWVNIPIAIGLIALAWWKLGGVELDAPPSSSGIVRRLDLPGFVLLSVFLVAINLALASGGEIGATAGRGLRAFGGTPNPMADHIPLLLVIAAVTLVFFVFWFRREPDPLIPKRLLRFPSFRASLVTNFLLGTVLMTGMVNVPVLVALLETGADTASRSALLLAPFTASIAIFSIVSARLMRRWASDRVTRLGVVIALVGNLSIYPLLELADYEWMTAGLAIAGAGIGLALTPLGTTALQSTTQRDRGAAASALLVVRLLGMTIGMSVLTSLGVQRLQVLTGRLEPMVRGADESTAEFLLRQQVYVIEEGLPLGVQVVQETFLVAAILTAIALIPARRLGAGEHRS